MNPYYIILDPSSYRKTVLIYDAKADVFYTAPRYVESEHSKKDMMVLRFILYFAVVLFFDRCLSTYTLSNKLTMLIYMGLFVMTVFISAIYSKNDLKKLNDSLQSYHYQTLNTNLASELRTSEQRKAYFCKLQSMRNSPKILLCCSILIVLCVLATRVLINNYTTVILFGVLLLLYLLVVFFYSAMNTYTDPNVKFLLERFC